MIHAGQLEECVELLLPQFSELDEHTLRLHLMAYSVYDQIYRKKRGWFLLKHIEWGYFGLLKFDVVIKLLKQDPFGIVELPDDEREILHELIWSQVRAFRERLPQREPVFYQDYDNYEQFLNELAVLDREAVRPWEDDARWREENKGDLVKHVKRYAHSLMVDVEQKRFIVDTQKFSADSYMRYSDWLITEFLIDDYAYPLDGIFQEITSKLDVENIHEIYCLNCGVGSGLLELYKRFPEWQIGSIEGRTRSVLENFLCEINLWPAINWMSEPMINWAGNPFEEYESNVRDETPSDEHHLVLGVISEQESSGTGSISKHIFPLSHSSRNFENKLLELLISKLSDSGSAFIALPQRFFHLPESRLLRELCLEHHWIRSISDVPRDKSGPSFGSLAILHLNKGAALSEVQFQSDGSRMQTSFEKIRVDNPELDLRPGRFVDSIEYHFQAPLSFFNDEADRERLAAVLKKLRDQRVSDEDFVALRRLVEVIIAIIQEKKPGELNAISHVRGVGRLAASVQYLSGEPDFLYPPRWTRSRKPFLPRHVGDCLRLCITFGNKGAHHTTAQLTKDDFRAATFALLAAVAWLKETLGKR